MGEANPSPERAEEIARGLTKAQIAVVLSLKREPIEYHDLKEAARARMLPSEEFYPAAVWMHHAPMSELADSFDEHNGHHLYTYYCITPLGLAVAKHLKGKTDGP